MRNLTLISSWESQITTAKVTATTFDLDENVIYAASEAPNLDGEVDVALWKIDQSAGFNKPPAPPTLAANFQTLASSSGPGMHQTIALRFMAETRKICAIMRSGDVVVVPVEDEGAPFEVEGTFESGILAASWNPDESVVAIVTGERKLIILTSTFDVLSERPIYVEEFGEDAPINVGWGSKQTQFHGSLGKTAAQAVPTEKVGASPDDDNLPRISWRGDGLFFAVSSLSPAGGAANAPDAHRALRVYDREGVLQATSEPVAGLEHALAWRPTGNLLMGTQRFGFVGGGAGRAGRHDVVFFERNGLRHGEFGLRPDVLGVKGTEGWGYRVRELAWNSDSNVLAVWIEGEHGDVVQFWTTGNYHWYLKHEISAPSTSASTPGRFTSFTWHPELTLHLALTTEKTLLQRMYSWDTFSSIARPPNDSGAVAVFDGSQILLTPFRSQNIPPPMSSFQLAVSPPTTSLARTPIYATFCPENDTLGLLWEHGYVEIWELHMRLLPGLPRIMDPTKVWAGSVNDDQTTLWRQLSLESAGVGYTVRALGTGPGNVKDTVAILKVQDGVATSPNAFQLPHRNCRLLTGSVADTYQGPDGEIFTYQDTHKDEILLPIARFAEFCIHVYKVAVSGEEAIFIGLAKSGKLYASRSFEETRILSANTTSFTLAPAFVIFTTNTHEAVFAPIASLPGVFACEGETVKDLPAEWERRKVERGSRIVVAVPSAMSLVLQMPRGNLETINPRPLVMEVVKADLDAGNYRKAFFACRKHRIDLNVIVDHDPAAFCARIPAFVDQIPEVDHLNLFLTLIGRGAHTPEFIAQCCDAFRAEFERRDLTEYVNSILTAHVVKTPPDHEAGLSLLLRLRESHPDIVEEAVKYIIFLVDANQLFDTALGMYDFSLVIMIAQHAQKDPREYLPFLRELRALDKYYQRFKIDAHLKRHESALRNLSLAGPERFDEAVEYTEQNRLYESALAIWKGTEHHADILSSYGDWLFERREFRQAATAFVEAKRTTKALIAHEKGLDWQELFELAQSDDAEMDEEAIADLAYRVAEDLSSKKRYVEAGTVLLDYAQNTQAAVIALVQGNAFSEARRIIRLHTEPNLLEEIVHPASLESRAQISEDLTEMREQLRKQVIRLRELHIRKVEEPDAFYGIEDNPALANVDVMTDVSMTPTAFTRYTIAPTSASRSSRRTSRSKRKMERKVGSGRKGTVDEEEYLLRSVSKLAERFAVTQGETRGLLPHLFRFTEEHRMEGLALQRDVAAFEAELKEAVEEIWARPAVDGDEDAEPVDGWAARMAEVEKRKAISPIDQVPKPDAARVKDWQVNLLAL